MEQINNIYTYLIDFKDHIFYSKYFHFFIDFKDDIPYDMEQLFPNKFLTASYFCERSAWNVPKHNASEFNFLTVKFVI